MWTRSVGGRLRRRRLLLRASCSFLEGKKKVVELRNYAGEVFLEFPWRPTDTTRAFLDGVLMQLEQERFDREQPVIGNSGSTISHKGAVFQSF